jgi:hypothetical protein
MIEVLIRPTRSYTCTSLGFYIQYHTIYIYVDCITIFHCGYPENSIRGIHYTFIALNKVEGCRFDLYTRFLSIL